jgi:hypothetical protein
MDVESEIRELKRRVGDLEGAVNVLAGQIGKVHPEVVSLSKSTETRFDTVEHLMVKVSDRLDLMNTQLWSLRDDLPTLVGRGRNPKTGEN